MNEIRHVIRGFAKTPAFTVAALLALALGIGATTAVFSVVNAVLLRPLPYGDADRVVRVRNHWEGTPRGAISPAEHVDYLGGTTSVFSDYGVWATGTVNVTGGGEPERVGAAFMTVGALAAFGVEPLFGRVLAEGEDAPGSTVAVLSHGFWQRRFGGSRDIVGSEVMINGASRTVIGVMPPSFRLPDDLGVDGGIGLYLGAELEAAPAARGSHFLSGVARLAPGVTFERADETIRAVAARFVSEFPDDYPREMRFDVALAGVRDDVVGNVRPVLFVLLGAVGFVLLIACANVASLMLTRAEARRSEIGVRVALGAGPAQLARLLLTESLVLACAGGLLGVLLAIWGTTGLAALEPQGIPRIGGVGVDASVLAFSATATLLTGIIFGLAPVLSVRQPSHAVLREGGRGTTTGRQRVRSGLIVAEIALALVLLAGAGLLVRSFIGLLRVDPGFETRGILTVRLTLPVAPAYAEDEARRAFYATLVERLAASPGVVAAGAVTNLPLTGSLGDINMMIEGRTVREGEVSPRLDWQAITPGYFDAIGMRIVRGRGITTRDDARAPGAVVINEIAARTIFPGVDPIGLRFTLGGGAGPGMVTIVGIVRDIRHSALGAMPRGEMYLPHAQFTFWNGGQAARSLTLAVRTTSDPATIAATVRREITALDPALPPGAFQTMEQVAAQSMSHPRFVMVLLATFSAIALLLALVGIYGVVAYAVSQRTRELGIRVALGAQRVQVIGLVMRQVLGLIGAGIAIGLGAALLLTRTLSGLLYDVPARDPVTLACVSAVLGGAALFACLGPARRATRVDPVDSLRVG